MFGIERKYDNRSRADTGESEPKEPDPMKPTTADHPMDETQAKNLNNFAEFDSFENSSRTPMSTIQEASGDSKPGNIQNSESTEQVSRITCEQNSSHPTKDINSAFEKNKVHNISTESNKEDTKRNFKIPIVGKPNLLLKRRKYVPNLSAARERHCDSNRSSTMSTPQINVDNSDPPNDSPSIVSNESALNNTDNSSRAEDNSQDVTSQNLEETNTLQNNMSTQLPDSFKAGSQAVASTIQQASCHLEPGKNHISGRKEETSTLTCEQNNSHPTTEIKLAIEEKIVHNISTESNKADTKPNLKIPLVGKPNLLLKRRKYVPNLSAARERHCDSNRSSTMSTPQINVDNSDKSNDSPSIASIESALNNTDNSSRAEDNSQYVTSQNLEESNTLQNNVSTLPSDSFKKGSQTIQQVSSLLEPESNKENIKPYSKIPLVGNPNLLLKRRKYVPNLRTARERHCDSNKSTAMNSPQINVDNSDQPNDSLSIVIKASDKADDNYSMEETGQNLDESNIFKENVSTLLIDSNNINHNKNTKTTIPLGLYKKRVSVPNLIAARSRPCDSKRSTTINTPKINVNNSNQLNDPTSIASTASFSNDTVNSSAVDHLTDETQAKNSNNLEEIGSFEKCSKKVTSTIQQESSHLQPVIEENIVHNIPTESNKVYTKPNSKIPIVGKPNLLLKRRKYVPNLSATRERHYDSNNSTTMNIPQINVDNIDQFSIASTASALNDTGNSSDDNSTDDIVEIIEISDDEDEDLEESNTFTKIVNTLLSDSFEKDSQTVKCTIQEASNSEPGYIQNIESTEQVFRITREQNSSHPTKNIKSAFEKDKVHNIPTESCKEHIKQILKIPNVGKTNLHSKRRKYVPNLSAARESQCDSNRPTKMDTPRIKNVDNSDQTNKPKNVDNSNQSNNYIVSTASALNDTCNSSDDNSTDDIVEIIEISDEDEDLEETNTFKKNINTLLSDSFEKGSQTVKCTIQEASSNSEPGYIQNGSTASALNDAVDSSKADDNSTEETIEIIEISDEDEDLEETNTFKKNVNTLLTVSKNINHNTIPEMDPSGLFKIPYYNPNLSRAKKKQRCDSNKSTINSPQMNVENRGQSKDSSSIVSTAGASNDSVNNSSKTVNITTDEIDHNFQETNYFQENENTEAEVININKNTTPKMKILSRVYKKRKLVTNFSVVRGRHCELKTSGVPSSLLNVEGPCVCPLLDCPHGNVEKKRKTPAMVATAVSRAPSCTASSSEAVEICYNLEESTILKEGSVQNINYNYLLDETSNNPRGSMILKAVNTGNNKKSTNKQKKPATIENQKEVNTESNKEHTNQRVVPVATGNKIKPCKQPQRKKLQAQKSCDKIKSNKKTKSSSALISKRSANEKKQEHDSGNTSIEEESSTDAEKELARKLKDGVPKDKMKLTLGDLIHYNPTSNPMPDIIQDEIPLKKIADETTTKSKRVRILVPQLKVGSDGKVVLDDYREATETSDSGVRGNDEEVEEDKEDDEEEEWPVRKRKRQPYRRNRWNVEETISFYKALNEFGSDFSMMESHFENRTRRDCYLKFKREENIRLWFVDRAMTQKPGKFDLNLLEQELTRKSAERKRKEQEKIRKREEKKFLREKKKAQKLEDKIRAKKLRELISRELRKKKRMKQKKVNIRDTRFVPKTMFDRDWDQDNDRMDYQSLFEVEESSRSPKTHLTRHETRALARKKKQLERVTLQETLIFELKLLFDELDEKAEQVGLPVSNVNLEHSPLSSDDSENENVLFKDIY